MNVCKEEISDETDYQADETLNKIEKWGCLLLISKRRTYQPWIQHAGRGCIQIFSMHGTDVIESSHTDSSSLAVVNETNSSPQLEKQISKQYAISS